jgi:hypothetical protein
MSTSDDDDAGLVTATFRALNPPGYVSIRHLPGLPDRVRPAGPPLHSDVGGDRGHRRAHRTAGTPGTTGCRLAR